MASVSVTMADPKQSEERLKHESVALGRFELPEGGTIFLDEVGELPVETQITLLRVLLEHEFERVGGIRSIRTNVRDLARPV